MVFRSGPRWPKGSRTVPRGECESQRLFRRAQRHPLRQEDHRPARRPAGLLRLPPRALDQPADHEPDRVHLLDVRLRTRVIRGAGSRRAAAGMAYELLDAAQDRWHCSGVFTSFHIRSPLCNAHGASCSRSLPPPGTRAPLASAKRSPSAKRAVSKPGLTSRPAEVAAFTMRRSFMVNRNSCRSRLRARTNSERTTSALELASPGGSSIRSTRSLCPSSSMTHQVWPTSRISTGLGRSKNCPAHVRGLL